MAEGSKLDSSASSAPATPTIFNKLKAPMLSELHRKRKVHANPSIEREARDQRRSAHVGEFPKECLTAPHKGHNMLLVLRAPSRTT